ncbi:MAG: phage holin family protein [Oscillospiraceae bacterium]|uniref:phage holin, LLH family n=1 Tax=Intestinimonas butyriciproducens TaxID=1297617 RepID=UPI002A8134D9|nr:phage holin, LLH family [Intestinimonas butyriciproducens]MCI6025942.1 phage holin family protein [Oscillospiraceae bacterium]MDY3219701.1 phage holin, LLH family [Candidatus Fimivivens sp.]MDY3615000.1 phage holin, LLH family [Intestinimonas butyriciproducens]
MAAVNQIYYDLDGPEKLQKAIESASEMLAAKGITVTELELRMLLEAAVNAAKGGTANAVA